MTTPLLPHLPIHQIKRTQAHAAAIHTHQQHRSGSIQSSRTNHSVTRTSPRLDVTAAFFSGIPNHHIRVMATYSVNSDSIKQYLLTGSDQGELVHWTYIPSIGYQARALLIPPTTNIASSTSIASSGHRRSHWMPSIPGASIINQSSCPAPQLNCVTQIMSCRVASKDVFVTADTAGGMAQWSVEGDCCYCSARLCPYPIDQMRLFDTRPQESNPAASSNTSSGSTYAICSSRESPLIFIIDLLQMHVIRCLDITNEPPDQAQPIHRTISEEQMDADDDSLTAGVSCMDIRHVIEQDMNMIPSHIESQQLIVLSTLGHLSVWDLTSIVLSTLQLSSDSTAVPASSSFDGTTTPVSASTATRRSRVASMASSFFASLPPLDSTQSSCISVTIQPLACLASPIQSMCVYSAPMPNTTSIVCSSAAFILLVMTRHWIILDGSTLTPIIPLQLHLTEESDLIASPFLVAESISSTVTMELISPLPSTNSLILPDTLPLPVAPSPSQSRRSSVNEAGPPLRLPPTSTKPNPPPHAEDCCLLGGSFLYSPSSSVAVLAPPNVLLWCSCGQVWSVEIVDASPSLSTSTTSPTPPVPPFLRTHSSPAMLHVDTNASKSHSPTATVKFVGSLNRPRTTDDPSTSFAVHLPSSSNNIYYESKSNTFIPILIGSDSGQLVEYDLASDLHESRSIEPLFITYFTDSFATPTYLHQFPSAHPLPVLPSSSSIAVKQPLLTSSAPATCTSMIFDLISHLDFGMTSLLIMLVKGFASGRIEFYKILTSAIPRSVSDAEPMSPTSQAESVESESYHAIDAHTAPVTAIIAFQAHESIFAIPLLVSGSLDGTVAVWAARTSVLVFRLSASSPILDLTRPMLPPPPTPSSNSGDGDSGVRINVNMSCTDFELVCVLCADYSVRLFSIARMGWLNILRGHDSVPRSVYRDEWALLSDRLFVLTERGTIYIWSLTCGLLEEMVENDSLDQAREVLQRFPIYGGGTAATRITAALRSPSLSVHTPSRHSRAMSLSPGISPKLNSNTSPARSKSIMQHQSFGTTFSPSAPIAPLSGISEGSNQSVSALPPQSTSITSPTHIRLTSHSPPLTPAMPVHSTSRLTTSTSFDDTTPPRSIRASTNPTSTRPKLSPNTSTFGVASSLPGMKTATWAVHYGLQRLWKLGGKGGLWSTAATDNDVSSTGSPDGTPNVTSVNSSSNLICSFESLPSLHLNLFSIDIGYFTAEMKHSYAPLDASSDSYITSAPASMSNIDTKHRAEVYKEILKLIMDWNDDTTELDDVIAITKDQDSSDTAGILDILRTKFHMRAPYTNRGQHHGVGGSLSTCYACYSPTNNALTILLPRTCSTKANRTMIGATHSSCDSSLQLAHLSRWSIGPNFSANHSLALTTVLLSLLGSSDIQLHNYYSLLEAFYNATLPTLHSSHHHQHQHPSSSSLDQYLWRYTEADIPFLSSYALHEHEDIRRGSRLLIQGIIGRMPLQELWYHIREWSSFYENMGTSAPPPLPWNEQVITNASNASSTVHSFPVAPRYVSDFEFMTSMILCYLYPAQAKKMREPAATFTIYDPTPTPPTPPTPMSSVPQSRSFSRSGRLSPSMHEGEIDEKSDLNVVNTLSSLNSSTVKHSRSSSTSDEPQSVISLNSAMFGLSLKVEPSPKHHHHTDDSKHDIENTAPTSMAPPVPMSLPPADKTPWIISTLLRLLAQTHQDSSLHSIQKSSICVELLIQGLTQPSRQTDENEVNMFWKYIPVSALEPLYRIIFDLSFVPPSINTNATPSPTANQSNTSAPPSSVTSPHLAFSNNCRVLLFELGKFDVPHFIEWVRKEIFGYDGVVGLPQSTDQASLDPSGNVKKAAHNNVAATTASISSAAPAALTLSSSTCASYKSQYFDEYRYQLILVLSTFPRKFSGRMNYGILKCLIDICIRVLDPLLPCQNAGPVPTVTHLHAPPRTGTSPSHASHPSLSHLGPAVGGGFLPLRGRFLQILHPFFLFLHSKYSWISFCSGTMKFAMIENLRWIYYERCGLGFYKLQKDGQIDTTTDHAIQQQQQYLQSQPPLIHIYDIQTAAKWRTYEGHAAGSEIDCIAFSPNGHLLASYCSTDLPQPTLRVWSSDYESSSVGSGFFPTRLLLKTIFKVNPFCTQVLELPHLSPQLIQTRLKARREGILHLHGLISPSKIHWKDNDAIILTREDDTTINLKL